MTGGWFITGTDTGVGKTYFACSLLTALGAAGEKVVGMKPVASGCYQASAGRRSEDAEHLQAASSITADYVDINPYAFIDPIAPHLAAAAEGVVIQINSILTHFKCLQLRAQKVVVEGVGGWCVPLGKDLTMIQVAQALGLPVIMVVGLRLGCLNHALLTASAIRASGVPLYGWVANHIEPGMRLAQGNVATLAERLDAPLLATFSYGQERAALKITPSVLAALQN